SELALSRFSIPLNREGHKDTASLVSYHCVSGGGPTFRFPEQQLVQDIVARSFIGVTNCGNTSLTCRTQLLVLLISGYNCAVVKTNRESSNTTFCGIREE